MFCGVVVTVDVGELGAFAAGVVIVVVVSAVVIVEAVESVLVFSFCPPQEPVQKRTTASNGVVRKIEGFIVNVLKIMK
jgi:hypothetical protein